MIKAVTKHHLKELEMTVPDKTSLLADCFEAICKSNRTEAIVEASHINMTRWCNEVQQLVREWKCGHLSDEVFIAKADPRLDQLLARRREERDCEIKIAEGTSDPNSDASERRVVKEFWDSVMCADRRLHPEPVETQTGTCTVQLQLFQGD